ncbi:MAG: hypothetical protein ACKV2V_04145 [Blastocatellia bacterium]
MKDFPQLPSRAARMTARILSILILLFWGFFLVAHLMGSEGSPSRPLVTADFVMLASIVVALAGLALAWRRETAGALTTLIAIGVCAAVNWKVLVFPGTLIPATAVLFLISAIAGNSRSQ